MNKSILFASAILALGWAGCVSAAEPRASVTYSQTIGGVLVPPGATPRHKELADRLARAWGKTAAHEWPTNQSPGCCTWVEIVDEGTTFTGYVIRHNGGTRITATSTEQLAAAVERCIKASRRSATNSTSAVWELPVGLMTNYKVVPE